MPAAQAAEQTPLPASDRFRGILLRDEARLAAGAFPGAAAGTRLSAAETGTESALFFPSSDGWEDMRPEVAETLTPGRLEELLYGEAPEPTAVPRLVYGFTLFCAALVEGDGPHPAPGTCRLALDSLEGEIEAELLSVTADALGRRMLVIRLTEFPEALYGMRIVAGTIEE